MICPRRPRSGLTTLEPWRSRLSARPPPARDTSTGVTSRSASGLQRGISSSSTRTRRRTAPTCSPSRSAQTTSCVTVTLSRGFSASTCQRGGCWSTRWACALDCFASVVSCPFRVFGARRVRPLPAGASFVRCLETRSRAGLRARGTGRRREGRTTRCARPCSFIW